MTKYFVNPICKAFGKAKGQPNQALIKVKRPDFLAKSWIYLVWRNFFMIKSLLVFAKAEGQTFLESQQFFCQSDFTWNQLLTNWNCQELYFANLEFPNYYFCQILLFFTDEIYQNQDSDTTKWSKLHFLRLYTCQKLFHNGWIKIRMCQNGQDCTFRDSKFVKN